MIDLDRRQLAALDAYFTTKDDEREWLKRRAEWEGPVLRELEKRLAKQYPSDLEREADVALAEEVFGE